MLSDKNTIGVVGDFNNSIVWDKPKTSLTFQKTIEKFKTFGMFSVYHKSRGENFGNETKATLYLTKKKEKTYHSLSAAFVFSRAARLACRTKRKLPSNRTPHPAVSPIVRAFASIRTIPRIPPTRPRNNRPGRPKLNTLLFPAAMLNLSPVESFLTTGSIPSPPGWDAAILACLDPHTLAPTATRKNMKYAIPEYSGMESRNSSRSFSSCTCFSQSCATASCPARSSRYLGSWQSRKSFLQARSAKG